MYTKTISRLRLGDYKPIKCRIRILRLATSSFFSFVFVWINRMAKFKGFGYSEVIRNFNCYIRIMIFYRYLFSVVETPRKFIITEFSIRKLGSSNLVPRVLSTVFRILSSMVNYDSNRENIASLVILYAIIMFRRCHELSRVQRVNTVLLAEEKASREVIVA